MDRNGYKNVINIITLKEYGIKKIRELILTIYTLLKIEPKNCRVETIEFVKNKTSIQLNRKIQNIKCIYDIISELIKIDQHYNKSPNNTYNYIKF